MIPRDEAEAFWGVTRDCLIQFHGFPPADAAQGVASLRESLAEIRVPHVEMIYHAEPFDVACDIAKKQLDRFIPHVAEEYYRMLDRPYPEVRV
jgi:hypothetical protein